MKRQTNLLARATMTLLLAVLCSAGARAADETAPGIVVWMNDGNKVEVMFSDMPEFTYSDGNVVLQTSRASLSWPLENVQKFTFGEVSTSGIKPIGLDFASGNIAVYDLNGKLVKSNINSISELPRGVYIVKDGRVTTKVVRK